MDLSKETEIESYIKQVQALYPNGVDILVNNAGMFNALEMNMTC